MSDTEDQVNNLLNNYLKEMDSTKIEAEAGGEFVKVKIEGSGRILHIECEDNEIVKQDISMLLDLIRIAYNSARDKLDEKMKDRFKDEIDLIRNNLKGL